MNLCPGGQPIQAQIVWKHRGIDRNGRGSTTRRVAYLYALNAAKPKRVPTPTQREAVDKALAARRTCPTCGVEQEYYIPRSRGECNHCAEPELYVAGTAEATADTGWPDRWSDPDELSDADWDPEALADLEAS
jgi:hypothetical protein